MYCPNCRAKYGQGLRVCPECEVSLTADLPPNGELDYVHLTTVLETGSPSVISLAQTILEDNDIECLVKGEHVQQAMGARGASSGFNGLMGAAEIQVRPEDAEAAIDLLAHLEEEDNLAEEEED